MNQNQKAELFDTSKQSISYHVNNILKKKELNKNSVIKYSLTTASDGKDYQVVFYVLDMALAISFRYEAGAVPGLEFGSIRA